MEPVLCRDVTKHLDFAVPDDECHSARAILELNQSTSRTGKTQQTIWSTQRMTKHIKLGL